MGLFEIIKNQILGTWTSFLFILGKIPCKIGYQIPEQTDKKMGFGFTQLKKGIMGSREISGYRTLYFRSGGVFLTILMFLRNLMFTSMVSAMCIMPLLFSDDPFVVKPTFSAFFSIFMVGEKFGQTIAVPFIVLGIFAFLSLSEGFFVSILSLFVGFGLYNCGLINIPNDCMVVVFATICFAKFTFWIVSTILNLIESIPYQIRVGMKEEKGQNGKLKAFLMVLSLLPFIFFLVQIFNGELLPFYGRIRIDWFLAFLTVFNFRFFLIASYGYPELQSDISARTVFILNRVIAMFLTLTLCVRSVKTMTPYSIFDALIPSMPIVFGLLSFVIIFWLILRNINDSSIPLYTVKPVAEAMAKNYYLFGREHILEEFPEILISIKKTKPDKITLNNEDYRLDSVKYGTGAAYKQGEGLVDASQHKANEMGNGRIFDYVRYIIYFAFYISSLIFLLYLLLNLIPFVRRTFHFKDQIKSLYIAFSVFYSGIVYATVHIKEVFPIILTVMFPAMFCCLVDKLWGVKFAALGVIGFVIRFILSFVTFCLILSGDILLATKSFVALWKIILHDEQFAISIYFAFMVLFVGFLMNAGEEYQLMRNFGHLITLVRRSASAKEHDYKLGYRRACPFMPQFTKNRHNMKK